MTTQVKAAEETSVDGALVVPEQKLSDSCTTVYLTIILG